MPVTITDVQLDDAPDLSVLPALHQLYPEISFVFEDHHFMREVGTLRVPVLLSNTPHKRPQTSTPSATKISTQTTIKNKASDALLRRITACSGSTAIAANSVVEGGNAVNTPLWCWFSIGGAVYLVSTRDGMVYSGKCRDLLAFYLCCT